MKKILISLFIAVNFFIAGLYIVSQYEGGSRLVPGVLADRDEDKKGEDKKIVSSGTASKEKKEESSRKTITVPNDEKKKVEKKEEEKKEEKKAEEKKVEKKEEEKKKEEKKEEEKKKEEKKEEKKQSEETIVEPKKESVKKEVVTEKEVTIETKDSTAKKVEFYIKKEDGDRKVYLGTAENNPTPEDNSKTKSSNSAATDSSASGSSNWGLNVDVDERIPNGDYILSAEFEDEEGKYKSEEVKIQVDRGSSKAVESGQGEEQQSVEQKERRKEVVTDWDKDGLTDEEEVRLGTDPYAADTDQDGFLDSDEIKSGFDPLKFSPGDGSDKIAFEEPKKAGKKSQRYTVKEVALVKSQANNDILRITGKALANSFVTLYVYSDDPIVVTVKTDEYGDWSYDLDKSLENGNHEVYVAVTDNTGKITAKSSPLAFVKTAQAVSILPPAEANDGSDSPLEKSKSSLLIYFVLIVIVFVAVAVVLIGVLANHEKKQ